MKNYKEEEVIITKQVLISLTCDICKKTIVRDDYVEFQEFICISFTGGYGSIFGDGDTLEIDICQHCFKEKLGEYVRVVYSELGSLLEAYDLGDGE